MLSEGNIQESSSEYSHQEYKKPFRTDDQGDRGGKLNTESCAL